MFELVKVEKNDVYTDSLTIAIHSENEHESVKGHIKKHEERFLRMGTLPILNRESTGGRREQYYLLTEPQASFLITLLRNNDAVVNFKFELVNQFFAMRKLLLEKQNADWQQSRKLSKEARKKETDAIRDKLIPHAISQGSKNYKMFYTNYSRLVNLILGIPSGKRDNLTQAYIDAIRFMENAIENIISIEVDKGTFYKEIYYTCKAKCEVVRDLAFLPSLKHIGKEHKP